MDYEKQKVSLDYLIEVLSAPKAAGLGYQMERDIIPFKEVKMVLETIFPRVLTENEWEAAINTLNR